MCGNKRNASNNDSALFDLNMLLQWSVLHENDSQMDTVEVYQEQSDLHLEDCSVRE